MAASDPLRFRMSSGLMQAGRQWQKVVDAALAGHGLSNAMTTPLLMIGRAGGGVRQIELAQLIGVEGPSLVRILDKLAAAGLVRRENDVSDRRANKLWLTEAGEAIRQQLETQLNALRKKTFGDMSDAEMEAVLKLYRIVETAARGG
ncbi:MULTISPECIES: MarR family winged helix-turn-helix transcriptional regulator [Pseudoxanthomonas]|jgi:MarR family transcriptional regulator for hemolysin|uniref:MarR family transcriptional regulator n=2 Tax=Lysobacteraceae TaxID=32033 RepID=A0A4Q8LSM2_9GAMM|nr:MarR family transcriptional regulator [Pseudoxanthomonas winnipegensis]RZZ83805.1 MarR family transcriptional regulator [Pseudoxanthomonas winnipegensis]RZZ88355.1 MarR family transcriptional regulator [Pseudoxanthomonas winnipegensis]TAA09621.1 MarR family transcriptional regulator [Pseudoxanthomonas winnipegensis]TAA23002.1 MarR family transcriptional regulator [Pseudoxanthomonas winnipegensis]TAA26470.1 MarR family transcriptional regulator [Pseudoxanthomonas winnipegensis]